MKTIKNILIFAIIAVLMLNSCEKDENGNYVKYYQHVTGEGYVFYKYLDGTIAPYTDMSLMPDADGEIIFNARESGGGGMYGTYYDITSITVKTDNNGYYQGLKFAKSFKSYKMKYYTLWCNINTRENAIHWFRTSHVSVNIDTIQQMANVASKSNPITIKLDTLWLNQMY